MFRVSVTELCEFTAKQGDLDARFRPAPSAQEGMAGHLKLSARRGKGYEREIALQSRHGELEIYGRADSYCPATNELEEFKTHRGKVERIAANRRELHWAQLKFYGYQ
ncbi:MAG TPA: ATP-dependent DNA helicase, partial [Solimonas sp.]